MIELESIVSVRNRETDRLKHLVNDFSHIVPELIFDKYDEIWRQQPSISAIMNASKHTGADVFAVHYNDKSIRVYEKTRQWLSEGMVR